MLWSTQTSVGGHRHLPDFAVQTRRAHPCLIQRDTSHICRAAVVHPPPEYDFRSELLPSTRTLVAARYPELVDLVDQGVLVVHQRPADYVERRTDGYQEPEEVFIVGTAHVSPQSVVDVQRVIQAVRPENVVVELCRSRSAVLYDTDADAAPSTATSGQHQSGSTKMANKQQANMMALGGSSFLEALTRSVRLGGQSGLVLQLLLALLYRNAAGSLNVAVGEEFKAAARAAEEVGAQVVLGDRPVEITLQRAWTSLSPQQRLQLCSELLQAGTQPSTFKGLSQEQIREMMTDDFVTVAFVALSQRYPPLLGPLVQERDMYLAWSMRRSKAVNGCRSVVGVVGVGHLRGVTYCLRHGSSSLRFTDLVDGKNSSKVRRGQLQDWVGRTLLEAALLGGLYVAWTELPHPSL